MKILWHSNAPWAPTGYGAQTGLFTPKIRALGHDIAISAFWGLGGSRMEWQGMKVLPGDENWGNRLLPAYAAYHAEGEPSDCQVITLMDVWVLKPDLLSELKMASWVPVDHDPVPPNVEKFFAQSGAQPIAMSKFGQEAFAARDIDALYVPHGVDTEVFHPQGGRDRVRQAMGFPKDAFVVGMVANNKGTTPPRKAFPQAFEAVGRLAEERDDVFLYVHAEKWGVYQGINLPLLAEKVGLSEDRIRWAPQLDLQIGIPTEAMPPLYEAFDVLLNPSYGEGFGIPIVEAQACGTPVIVSDWSAMTELCGAGWLVDGERWWDASQGAYYLNPSVGSIVDCLREAYDGAESLRDDAVKFAAEYDVDRIVEHDWKPTLEMLSWRG